MDWASLTCVALNNQARGLYVGRDTNDIQVDCLADIPCVGEAALEHLQFRLYTRRVLWGLHDNLPGEIWTGFKSIIKVLQWDWMSQKSIVLYASNPAVLRL